MAAEDPFANLREVAYDYAGLDFSPLLGKTLFRPAVIVAMHEIRKEGGFDPDEVSPEKAVAERAFPILLICGTADHRIPCRRAEQIYNAARGPKELWIAQGAGHAGAFGHAPAEYERRVISFFEKAAGIIEGSRQRETNRGTIDPMTNEANELLRRALNLSVAERAELAGSLIESLDDTEDEAVKAAWEEEIVRRMKDFDSGVAGIPLDEARRRLRSVVE